MVGGGGQIHRGLDSRLKSNGSRIREGAGFLGRRKRWGERRIVDQQVSDWSGWVDKVPCAKVGTADLVCMRVIFF